MKKFNYRKNYPEERKEPFRSSTKRNDMLSQLILEGYFTYKSDLNSEENIYKEFKMICDRLGLTPITDASRRKKTLLKNDQNSKISSVDLEYPHVNPHSETSFSPAKPALVAFVCLDIEEAASKEGVTTIIDGEEVWKQLNTKARSQIANIITLYNLSIDIPVKKNSKLKAREWYLDYSCISNTEINYQDGKLNFNYFVPYVNEHPITKKLSIANHTFIDLLTEPQIKNRSHYYIKNNSMIEADIPESIDDAVHNHIRTIKWEKGLSVFIDNSRCMHGRLAYDMNLKRNIYIRQYKKLNILNI